MQKLEVGPPVRPLLRAPEHHDDVVLRSRDSCLHTGGGGGIQKTGAYLSPRLVPFSSFYSAAARREEVNNSAKHRQQ